VTQNQAPVNRAERRVRARRRSSPPPPSVTASGEVVGSDFGRRDEHRGASMSVAWMPIGRACQQPTFTVSDVRRSGRTTRNTSIKSRDAQDPVPILVTGRSQMTASSPRPPSVKLNSRWKAGDNPLYHPFTSPRGGRIAECQSAVPAPGVSALVRSSEVLRGDGPKFTRHGIGDNPVMRSASVSASGSSSRC
jgi:hypothetical protein